MTTAKTIEHRIPGLNEPAEIIVDRWGIPHIRARTRHDVFFLQGLNAARDRLWQLDLWRKRGLGLLAADFGPGFLAQDRAARLFLYRGDMEAEWKAYGNRYWPCIYLVDKAGQVRYRWISEVGDTGATAVKAKIEELVAER